MAETAITSQELAYRNLVSSREVFNIAKELGICDALALKLILTSLNQIEDTAMDERFIDLYPYALPTIIRALAFLDDEGIGNLEDISASVDQTIDSSYEETWTKREAA